MTTPNHQSTIHCSVSANSRIPSPIVLPSLASSDLNHDCCSISMFLRLEAMVRGHPTQLTRYGLTSGFVLNVTEPFWIDESSLCTSSSPRQKGMLDARLSAIAFNVVIQSTRCSWQVKSAKVAGKLISRICKRVLLMSNLAAKYSTQIAACSGVE